MQVRRDLLVLQAQHDFDQARDAGRRFQVADVGLDRHRASSAAFSGRGAPTRSPSASTSIGSPSDVPVPCAST